jgi:hypothetical protein
MWKGTSQLLLVAACLAATGCTPQKPPSTSRPSPVAPSASVAAPPASLVSQPLGTEDGLASDPTLHDPSRRMDDEAESAEEATSSATGLLLSVREAGPSLPWTVTIENRGGDPVELVADSRLLAFSVRAPGMRKRTRCALPNSSQPEGRDPATVVVLQPGQSVSEDFDPRFFCFEEGGQRLLVPGALITPYFGWEWREPTRSFIRGRLVTQEVQQLPPFVAESLPAIPGASDETEPKVSDKQLVGQTFALASDYESWSRARRKLAPAGDAPQVFELELTQGSDAEAERNATVTMQLTNRSATEQRLFFRRELVSFVVIGPTGDTQICNPVPEERAPDRQAFMKLAVGEHRSYTTRLTELCPRGSFGAPGLYRVHARFVANADGRDQGLLAFTGTVTSRGAAVLRIRTGETRLVAVRPMERENADRDAP